MSKLNFLYIEVFFFWIFLFKWQLRGRGHLQLIFVEYILTLKEVEKLEQNIDVNKTPCSMSQSIRPKMCSEIRGALDNFLAYFLTPPSQSQNFFDP